MSRKGKYSKEIKIKACEDYIAGKGSFESIAKSILNHPLWRLEKNG